MRAVLLSAVVSLASLQGVVRPDPPLQLAPDEADPVLEEFDVARDGDLLCLPVQIGGRSYLFALDTGCTYSVYDDSFRLQLGNPASSGRAHTATGDTTVDLFRSPDAFLGRLSLRTPSPVVTFDLSGLREASGHAVFGIIGMDFLSRHIVRIDFDRGKLTFLRRSTAPQGQPVSLEFEMGLPHVRATIPGCEEPLRFLVDTGAAVTCGYLDKEMFGALARSGRIKHVRDAHAWDLLGVAEEKDGALEEIVLGEFRHGGLHFGACLKNILGLGYWFRYVCTFDFPSQVLYLAKGARFAMPDYDNRSGVGIIHRAGKLVVGEVDAGSAAQGVLKTGDEILAVDGQPVGQLSSQAFYNLFRREGGRVALTVQRGDVRLGLTLTLPEQEKVETVPASEPLPALRLAPSSTEVKWLHFGFVGGCK